MFNSLESQEYVQYHKCTPTRAQMNVLQSYLKDNQIAGVQVMVCRQRLQDSQCYVKIYTV